MVLVSIQVCCGAKVIRDWGLVTVNDDSTVLEVFQALCSGQIESADGFRLPEQYADSPVTCMIGQSQSAKFQSIPLVVKMHNAVEFGKYLKFVLQCTNQPPTLSQEDAFTVLMRGAGRLMWPDKYDVSSRKNNRHKLHNDTIDFLQKKGLGWTKENVISVGKPFVTQLGDILWQLDGHHEKLAAQQCAVPTMFSEFQGYNTPENYKQKRPNLKRENVAAMCQILFGIMQQGWISSPKWVEVRDVVASLAEGLHKYTKYLEVQNEKTLTLQHAPTPARGASAVSLSTLPKQSALSQSTMDTLSPVYHALADKQCYDPVYINDHLPTDARQRYHFIQLLKGTGCPAEAVLYTYSTGNNNGNYHFVWLVPSDSSADELQSRNSSIVQEINAKMPQFHSRAMRQSFVHLFGRVASIQPVYLREMYRQLTGDTSAASSESQKAIDERVQQALDLEDPDVVVDLRHHNKGHPSKYDQFWEACERYIHSTIELAVDDRRHDRVAHLAAALSVNDMLSEVSKLVGSDVPVPSAQWLRLQFWPKNPTAKTSLQYTGKLKVKYMVQKRQLRKDHDDAHYASALFRYEKEMAIKFRSHATLVSLDDKHKVSIGEPGYPVASVERGKKVLVGIDQTFAVGDHDFTRCSLTPSVALVIDIPESIEGSFYHGKVYVGVKDSVFEPSSPHRHVTELDSLLTNQNDENPVLMVYTDGGPDHRVNFLSVQIWYMAIFIARDLDCLIAVRTPPYNSWKNPAERIMSELNLALQAVGMARARMVPNLEKMMLSCNSMKAIRAAAASNPQLREAFKDSLEPVILLLSSLFQRLKLKGEPFTVFTSATSNDLDRLEGFLRQIQPDIDPATISKTSLPKFSGLQNFLDHCCRSRHYSFSILKCGSSDCAICKPPRLPKEIFDTLHHIPDPIRDGDVYKPFAEVYGTETTENDRPSLKSSAEKRGHGMPFNPSGQFASNVGKTLVCTECNKPRVTYSSRKVRLQDKNKLELALNGIMYTCGMDLQECIPTEVTGDAKETHILSRVFVRQNLCCNTRIETPYFSSECFPVVCSYCGSDQVVPASETQEMYPLCSACKSDPNKPGILKRKRKLKST